MARPEYPEFRTSVSVCWKLSVDAGSGSGSTSMSNGTTFISTRVTRETMLPSITFPSPLMVTVFSP